MSSLFLLRFFSGQFEKFDHTLNLVATGDVRIYGTVEVKGDLALRANAGVSEASGSGGAGSGSVIIAGSAGNPVEVRAKGDTRTVDSDEHPRAGTTAAALGELRAAFRRDGGTVTAGNASGLNDGAAAIIRKAVHDGGSTSCRRRRWACTCSRCRRWGSPSRGPSR